MKRILLAVAFAALLIPAAQALLATPKARPTDGLPSGIAFYGVLEDGLKEAKATNRPILFLSAAPQCAGVPGMW